MDNQNDRDIYVIPPNFVDTGTFFGGMFKARNVIEAGILAGGTGIPIFLFLPAGLTVRIIVLCLTSLPLALLALIGISEESLTSFLAIFLKYLRNRRVVGGEEEEAPGEKKKSQRKKSGTAGNKSSGECKREAGWADDIPKHQNGGKSSKSGKARKDRKGNIGGISGWRRTGEEDFPEEFDQVKGYEIRQKLRPSQSRRSRDEWDGQPDGKRDGGSEGMGNRGQDRRSRAGTVQKRDSREEAGRQVKLNGQRKPNGQEKSNGQGKADKQDKAVKFHNVEQNRRKNVTGSKRQSPKAKSQNRDKYRASAKAKHQPQAFRNPVAEYLPIANVANGIIYTKDHRYVKVVEVVPINFLLRSAREQRGIIYSFVSYLKISPVKLQFKVLTRRADIGRHINTVRKEMAQETNGQCRLMQEDYLQFVQQISSREAVTRRFFLIFEYEPWDARRGDEEAEAISQLQGAVRTASNYLRQCGNEVIIPENEDEFTVDVLYNLLCRNESAEKPLSRKVQEVAAEYRSFAGESRYRKGTGNGFCRNDMGNGQG